MKIFMTILFFSLSLLLSFPASGAEPITFGYVAPGPYYYDRSCWERFQEELEVLVGDEFLLQFPSRYQLVDSWDLEETRKNFEQLLNDAEVDIILGTGLGAVSFIFDQRNLAKPVVLFGDLDVEIFLKATPEGTSRIPNLTFQIQRRKIGSELEMISKIYPGGEVTVLVDPEIRQFIPQLDQKILRLEKEHGIDIQLAFFQDTGAATVADLPENTKFIYLAPSIRFNELDKIKVLLEQINRRKIPTFAMEGWPVVELGALAGLYVGSVEKVAKNTALKVYEILRGVPPENLELFYRDKQEFAINIKTAREIGFYPSFELLMEAKKIGEQEVQGEEISISKAIALALENNLNYQLAQRRLEQEQYEYKKVMANLLPQVSAFAQYQQIDADRAKASAGVLNRWGATGTVSAEQLVFDYATWKALSLAALSVNSAQVYLDEVRLDTVEAAIQSYLYLLQSQELTRVQRENYENTRDHLETARVRLEQEVGSREDVLRWEAQEKSVLSSLVEAQVEVRKASLSFNQVLNRPLETPFHLVELKYDYPWEGTIFGDRRLQNLLSNWHEADLVRDFLVAEGLVRSPEVQNARLALDIAQADLVRSKAQTWSPTLSARFDYTRNFDEEVWDPISETWRGSDDYPDDNEWFFGASVSLPLWLGGSNYAEMGRGRVAVRQATQALELEKKTTALAIRSAFFDIASSVTTWELEQARSRLAKETMDIVEDKYRKGTLPILDLLDAQSENVSAQSSSVSSIYSAVSDLIRLERKIGFIKLDSEPGRADDLVEQMIAYLEANLAQEK